MLKKILIVDDEVDLAELEVQLFEAAGWEAASAINGKEALVFIEKFQPDVILSDITMPVMDGLTLIEQLYHLKIEIPLIFVTGFRDVEKMKKAWSFGAFDFLDKPFNEKMMLQIANNAYEFGKEHLRASRKRNSMKNQAS